MIELPRIGRHLVMLVGAAAAGEVACSSLIDADFDAKTTYPEYFDEAGGTAGVVTGGNTASGGGGDGDASGGLGGATGGAGGEGTGGTGGQSNVCEEASACSADGIVINEIRGQGGTDFIELYNGGDKPADLSGYWVSDGTNSSAIENGVVVLPGAFLYLQDNEGSQAACALGTGNCQWFNFGISSSGETVYLMTPDLSEIDSIEYPSDMSDEALINGETWGRLPDGADSLAYLSPTLGTSNVVTDQR